MNKGFILFLMALLFSKISIAQEQTDTAYKDLNDAYSLDNDVNAAANRFYNAAPVRNYFAGIALQYLSSKK